MPPPHARILGASPTKTLAEYLCRVSQRESSQYLICRIALRTIQRACSAAIHLKQ
jgi:hypothetical protein